MKRWQFVALAALCGALLVAGLVALALPGIVKSQAARRVEAATGRTLAIGGLSLNPFTWTVEVRDLRFSERGADETFAAFASARIGVSPSSLWRGEPVLAEARIASPYLRVVRMGKNAYNFSDLLQWLPRIPRLSVEDLTVRDATLAFSDHHVAGGYTATLRHFEGEIRGLSSEAGRLADVDLRGSLEDPSALRITGRVHPYRGHVFADLAVQFSAVSLPPLSPYLGTYLGYAVDGGQLSLDARYRIEHGKLAGENRIFIDQLALGRRVASDQATSFPVRLAVSLLRDRKGEIHLDLPVTGRFGNPQFGVGSVAAQVLQRLLIQAETAPLALLQSRFGWEEDLGSVAFAPGSAELAPSEQEKLRKLAALLDDRPALRMAVRGFVDPERDPDAYREVVSQRRTKEWVPVRTVVGDPELRRLAEARAGAVRAFLVEQGKIDPARVVLKSGDISQAPSTEGTSGSRVALEVAAE